MDSFFYFVESVIKVNPLFSFPLVFLSGLVLSFSPCFYPLVPVILGIIGVDENTSSKKSFLLSIAYILGLSLVYTSLGILSALSGSLFGVFSKMALIQFIGAGIFFIIGFSMLAQKAICSSKPSPVFSLLARFGFLGSFILGIISGLICGGCTFPVLGAILVLIALRGDVLFGGSLLFCFSLGLGSLFVAVALFGKSILDNCKKNFKLYLIIRKAIGVIIILMAGYFFVRGFALL